MQLHLALTIYYSIILRTLTDSIHAIFSRFIPIQGDCSVSSFTFLVVFFLSYITINPLMISSCLNTELHIEFHHLIYLHNLVTFVS